MEVENMTMKELEEMHKTIRNHILHEGCVGRSDFADLDKVSEEIKKRQEEEANDRARH